MACTDANMNFTEIVTLKNTDSVRNFKEKITNAIDFILNTYTMSDSPSIEFNINLNATKIKSIAPSESKINYKQEDRKCKTALVDLKVAALLRIKLRSAAVPKINEKILKLKKVKGRLLAKARKKEKRKLKLIEKRLIANNLNGIRKISERTNTIPRQGKEQIEKPREPDILSKSQHFVSEERQHLQTHVSDLHRLNTLEINDRQNQLEREKNLLAQPESSQVPHNNSVEINPQLKNCDSLDLCPSNICLSKSQSFISEERQRLKAHVSNLHHLNMSEINNQQKQLEREKNLLAQPESSQVPHNNSVEINPQLKNCDSLDLCPSNIEGNQAISSKQDDKEQS